LKGSRTKLLKFAHFFNIFLLALLLIFLLTLNQAAASPANSVTSNTNNSINPEELEAFMDGAVITQLKAQHIPGATVAVVQGDQIIFAKGYGYADIENRRRVVANQTHFRAGSVSKLFIWTAVMQLAEQGKLDLDADINTYLKDFQVPATYSKPITMKKLMTHTSGFEDLAIGGRTFVRNQSDVLPLAEYMETKMPDRVCPPGELTAYSNYGAALAAYIVEQVSGMPFDKYVEKNILVPLEMNNTSFSQPLPSGMASNMSNGYFYSNNVYTAKPFEYVQGWPAGSISSTSGDMARFMVAHLQNGKYGNSRILQEDTARKMHSHLFTNDPRVNGMAYGFWEINPENPRIIGHGGDTLLFHSQLILILENQLGLFVSCNEQASEPAVNEIVQAFIERYSPVANSSSPSRLQSPAGFEEDASSLAGSYRQTRSAYSNFERVSALFQEMQVSPGSNGTLNTFELTQGSRNWIETEPLVFSPAGGLPSQERLVFGKNSQGNINYLFIKLNPTTAYEKVPWHDELRFNLYLLGICLVLFLSTLLWPVGIIFNRCPSTNGKSARAARLIAGGASLINIFFLTGLISLFLTNPTDAEFIYSITPFLKFLLAIVLAGTVLTLVSTAFAFFTWKDKYWNIFGRFHYTLVVLSLLAFIWWLNNWNLLGFRF